MINTTAKLILLTGLFLNGNAAWSTHQHPSSTSVPGLKAVIFDWAGTTVDYGSIAPIAAFKSVFAEKGVPITDQEARQPMGVHKYTHIKLISENPAIAPQQKSVKERWFNKYHRYPTKQDLDDMFLRFTPLQKQSILEHAKLIPGTIETVAFIRSKGWAVGTTTGYTKEMLDIVATEAKKQGFLPDYNVASDQVKHSRPAPEMMWMLCGQFQVPCSATVKIDDTLPGIEEGRNAGAWTIMVLKTGNALGLDENQANALSQEEFNQKTATQRKEAEKMAHFVVLSIKDIPPILEQIDQLIKQGRYPFQYPPQWPA